MSRCKHCGNASMFLRAVHGLCRNCRQEIKTRVEIERKRIKEALVFVHCVQDPREQAARLRRAMGSAKALARYQRLGYRAIQPTPEALEKLLEDKLRRVQAELRSAGLSESAPTESSAVATPSPGGRPDSTGDSGAKGWERRRTRRRRTILPVRMEPDMRAFTEDVSPWGLRICSRRLPKTGSRVRVTLPAPAGPVTAEATVRWTRWIGAGATGSSPAVMGVEFSDPRPEFGAPR